MSVWFKRHVVPGPLWPVTACILLILFVIAAMPAFAALGEDVSSIRGDQSHLKASARFVPVSSDYSIEQMQTPAGTTIRQFVSSSGTVFAITWEGPAPDLQQLLGSYYEHFVAATASRTVRGRGLHIDLGDFVVETGGHMRYVRGRAFLRSKVPERVASDDIR